MTPAQAKAFGRAYRAYMRLVARRGVFLYAIQAGEGGPVKIGQTVDPAARLKTLQQANAETLIGLAAWRALPEEEKLWHNEFAEHRLRGEWFAPAPDLIDAVMLEGAVFCDWDA